MKSRMYYLRIIQVILIFLFSVLCAVPCFADTYTVYDDGMISTTYRDYFARIMADKDGNYVAWRSGQYEYSLAYGELTSNDLVVTGSARVVRFSTNSGYNSQISISSANDSAFTLDCGDNLLYSNILSDRPNLTEGGAKSYEVQAVVAAVAFFFVFTVVHDIYYWWRYSK